MNNNDNALCLALWDKTRIRLMMAMVVEEGGGGGGVGGGVIHPINSLSKK